MIFADVIREMVRCAIDFHVYHSAGHVTIELRKIIRMEPYVVRRKINRSPTLEQDIEDAAVLAMVEFKRTLNL